MKVMVCGAISGVGASEIRRLQRLLRRHGFEVIDQLAGEGMDYSSVQDFRDKRELARRIVERDIHLVQKADVIVAISDWPSFGTGAELYIAKELGKRVILFSRRPVASPWPVALSDFIAGSEAELLRLLCGRGSPCP